MVLGLNAIITGENCKYRINEQISPSCYLGTVILSGDLGSVQSDEYVMIATDQNIIGRIIDKFGDKIIEVINLHGNRIVILPHTLECKEWFTEMQNHPAATFKGGNKYNGETRNGVPHGFGTMRYVDGKIYTGYFVNGLRHGTGKLTMPNGEYFKGEFYQNIITENGIYFDEYGNQRIVKAPGSKSGIKILWDKSWRFFASIGFFAFAALTVWLIIEFFSSDSSGTFRVGIFIVPFVMGWYGIRYLFDFFSNLLKSN